MNRDLTTLTRELTDQKESLLKNLADWPETLLLFRPQAEAWSAVQVIGHLGKVEHEMVLTFRENLPSGQAVGIRDRVGAMIVSRVMLSKRKIRVPKGANKVIPEPELTFPEAVQHWEKARQDLHSVLASLSPDQLAKGFIRHPVSGWMTPAMMLRFLSCHLRHHVFQLDRINEAAGGVAP